MVKAWAPLGIAIDDLFQVFGRGRRELEFTSAIDIMTGAQGCDTRPILPAGDLLGQYVQLLYGAPRPGETSADASSILVQEPPVVAQVVLERVGGISLRQFAESFDGAAIKAMHRLMQSPRLEGNDLQQTVADFQREMHEFNGRRKRLSATSVGVDGTIALAGLSAGWGLLAVAVTVIAKHLITKSVLTDEQLARVLGSPKEAAYLARIDAAIKNT